MIALLGGTIGNFAPHQRAPGSSGGSRICSGEWDRFLLGTDLVKDRETLETAYNDPHGVTAEFQQERPLSSQPGARRRLRPQRLRARRALGPGESLWVDIRRACTGPGGERLRSTCWFRSRPARRCAPRSQPSSSAPDWKSTPTRGSSSPTGGPIRTSSTRSVSPGLCRPPRARVHSAGR